MGYHDAFNTASTTSRNFYSTAIGNKITYHNWASGEPNNRDKKEHCVLIWDYFNYYWNDFNCESKTGYICEEHSYTTKYRKDMETKQRAVFQKNTMLISTISSSQTEIDELIDSAQKDVDNLLLDYRKSTNDINTAWKKSIEKLFQEYPYMMALLNNFNDSFNAIDQQHEEALDQVTNKIRENNDDIYTRLKENTHIKTSEVSSKATENRNVVNNLLVFGG